MWNNDRLKDYKNKLEKGFCFILLIETDSFSLHIVYRLFIFIFYFKLNNCHNFNMALSKVDFVVKILYYFGHFWNKFSFGSLISQSSPTYNSPQIDKLERVFLYVWYNYWTLMLPPLSVIRSATTCEELEFWFLFIQKLVYFETTILTKTQVGEIFTL